jgi:DNA-binding transcriptional regulator YdaS (Cro superfamily)
MLCEAACKELDSMDRDLKEAIRVAGSKNALAQRLGVTRGAVSQWTRIPVKRVPAVERATGIPRCRLRPDLFLLAQHRRDRRRDVPLMSQASNSRHGRPASPSQLRRLTLRT